MKGRKMSKAAAYRYIVRYVQRGKSRTRVTDKEGNVAREIIVKSPGTFKMTCTVNFMGVQSSLRVMPEWGWFTRVPEHNCPFCNNAWNRPPGHTPFLLDVKGDYDVEVREKRRIDGARGPGAAGRSRGAKS